MALFTFLIALIPRSNSRKLFHVLISVERLDIYSSFVRKEKIQDERYKMYNLIFNLFEILLINVSMYRN